MATRRGSQQRRIVLLKRYHKACRSGTRRTSEPAENPPAPAPAPDLVTLAACPAGGIYSTPCGTRGKRRNPRQSRARRIKPLMQASRSPPRCRGVPRPPPLLPAVVRVRRCAAWRVALLPPRRSLVSSCFPPVFAAFSLCVGSFPRSVSVAVAGGFSFPRGVAAACRLLVRSRSFAPGYRSLETIETNEAKKKGTCGSFFYRKIENTVQRLQLF